MFLEIKDLKKSFGTAENRTEVLKGIDFSVEKGQICVLLGPSGSGKSTLLNIIGGIDQADEGYVSINGEKTADMKEKRLTQYRRRHLGYVFQMYNLIPNLSVRENIMNIATSCRTSFPADSSRGRQSGVQSSKIRTFFCVMSRRVHWITRLPKKSSA